MKRDYYEVLGVAREATQDDIKKAYRREALQHHPDRNAGDKDSERRFKEAAEAYEVLSDPRTRSRYDQFGHDGLSGAGVSISASRASAAGSGAGVSPGFSSVEDIFRAFGDVFGGGSIFDDLFGFNRRGARGSRRGASLKCEVRVSFEEMAEGVEKTISLRRHEACDVCGGTGARPGTAPRACTYCHGRGEIQQTQGFFTLRSVCPQCKGEGSVVEERCVECGGKGKKAATREIKVRIPESLVDGDYDVTVTTVTGTSNALVFTVGDLPLAVTSMKPNSQGEHGPNSPVVITGTGFGTMNKNSSVANHGGMGGFGRPELDLEVTWDDGSEADPVKGFVLYHTNREIVVIPPGGWFDPLPIGEYTVRVVLHPDSDEPEVASAGTYTVE